MPERYNDAYWKNVDTLISSSEVVVDRARGEAHPDYDDMIYPINYGYLAGTTVADGGGIDVFIGASGEKRARAVVFTVDLTKRDAEVKFLLGCTDDEMRTIVEFLNERDSMHCLLVKRED